MGDRTSCTRHAAKTRFFVLYDDFLAICERRHAAACALRVLETRTDDRLTYLVEDGRDIESIGIADLWMCLERRDFEERSLDIFNGRSYHEAIPLLEKKKFVKCRYVKLDQQDRPLTFGGSLLTWNTYKDAQRDHEHAGTIVKQYLYCYWEVNRAISEMFPDNPPEPRPGKGRGEPIPSLPERRGKSHGDKENGTGHSAMAPHEEVAPREGTPRTSTPRETIASIPQRMVKFPGGSTNDDGFFSTPPVGGFSETAGEASGDPFEEAGDPPGEISENQESLRRESRISKESSVAPPVVGAENTFFEERAETRETIWCVEGVLNLAAIYLPPLPQNRSHKQREADQQQWEHAARQIVSGSLYYQMEEAERVAYLVRLMRYMTDQESPCSWRRFMRERHPQAQIRLWHVANNQWNMGMEMERNRWWPREDDAPLAGSDQKAFESIVAGEDDALHQVSADVDDHDVPAGADSDPSLEEVEPEVTPDTLPQEPIPIRKGGMTELAARELAARIMRERPMWTAHLARPHTVSQTGYTVVVNGAREVCSVAEWEREFSAPVSSVKPSERLAALRRRLVG